MAVLIMGVDLFETIDTSYYNIGYYSSFCNHCDSDLHK